MASSRAPLAVALVILLTVVTASAQQAPSASRKGQTATREVSTTAARAPQVLQSAQDAAAVSLGQQRRQSFERPRELARATQPELLVQCAQSLDRHRSDSAQSATPGFGVQAGRSGPYVEERFADGTVIYRFAGGSVVAPPDRVAFYCPYQATMMQTPPAAPPDIPADNSPQAIWVRHHNNQLRAIIAKLINDDTATLQAIDRAAEAEAHGGLLQMADFLTGVANFYAINAP